MCIRDRHNISQPELAKEIGCSKGTISRFISGAKGTLTHEQVLKIARLFNVSTDFLLGETNIPDRKNYDIAELGLSCLLYTSAGAWKPTSCFG